MRLERIALQRVLYSPQSNISVIRARRIGWTCSVLEQMVKEHTILDSMSEGTKRMGWTGYLACVIIW